MPNMSPTKNPMPHQEPDVRNKNFAEVALGYSEETALNEAERCLGCANAPLCFRLSGAVLILKALLPKLKNMISKVLIKLSASIVSLPAVCGRVCPQESQCESACTRGFRGDPVGIGLLGAFRRRLARSTGEFSN